MPQRNKPGRWHVVTKLFLALSVAALTSAARAEDDAADGADAAALTPQQQEMIRKAQSIVWQEGPCMAPLGGTAQIKVPAGYRITDKAGTRIWSELTGNMPSDSEVGLLAPDRSQDESADSFVVVFSFDPSGYVKDDDKDKLDADAILKSIRAGNDEANKYRVSQGMAPLEITGWMQPPAYDATTHNLCWIIKARSEGDDIVNYNTRVLGRHGVMSVNLVANPDAIERLIPTAKQIVSDFDYKSGERYAEFQARDKVAQYGLTALVAGGAAAVALKTGLFAKLALVFAKAGKAIVVGVLALLGGIAKLFSGRNKSSS